MSLRTASLTGLAAFCASVSATAIGSISLPPRPDDPNATPPVAAMRMLDPVSHQFLSLILVTQRNAARFEYATGSSPTWGWPTPTHDIGTTQLEVAYRLPEGVAFPDAGGLSIGLSINGLPVQDTDFGTLDRSDICGGDARCLPIGIQRVAWPPFDSSGTNSRRIVLTIAQDGIEYSLAANIVPSAYPVSYFTHFFVADIP